jgi:hypothetical protein
VAKQIKLGPNLWERGDYRPRTAALWYLDHDRSLTFEVLHDLRNHVGRHMRQLPLERHLTSSGLQKLEYFFVISLVGGKIKKITDRELFYIGYLQGLSNVTFIGSVQFALGFPKVPDFSSVIR